MTKNAIVTYDISDDYFRSKVREFLKEFYDNSSLTFKNTADLVEAGAKSFEFGNQRSVFFYYKLEDHEFLHLSQQVMTIIADSSFNDSSKSDTDKILIAEIGAPIGHPYTKYWN